MASYPDNADNPRVDVGAYPTSKDLMKQPARDERERRALVILIRALMKCGDDGVRGALTVAQFMWPDAYEEAKQD